VLELSFEDLIDEKFWKFSSRFFQRVEKKMSLRKLILSKPLWSIFQSKMSLLFGLWLLREDSSCLAMTIRNIY